MNDRTCRAAGGNLGGAFEGESNDDEARTVRRNRAAWAPPVGGVPECSDRRSGAALQAATSAGSKGRRHRAAALQRAGDVDDATDAVLAAVNNLLGNVHAYQPKTGAKCGCKRGVQRDNCSACEGTGMVIDFASIRAKRPLVPIFVNRDPRGYALKVSEYWMRANPGSLPADWGGYGLIAPEF